MSKWPYCTAQWQRLRAAALSAQPLCEHCLRLEIIEPATVVDHVKSIASGGDPFPPLDGLASLCVSCHNHKTNAIDATGRATGASSGFKRAVRGYDLDGNPIDSTGWDDMPVPTYTDELW
jgi:5-methylcytosine-specific restriction endonuclease McrA